MNSTFMAGITVPYCCAMTRPHPTCDTSPHCLHITVGQVRSVLGDNSPNTSWSCILKTVNIFVYKCTHIGLLWALGKTITVSNQFGGSGRSLEKTPQPFTTPLRKVLTQPGIEPRSPGYMPDDLTTKLWDWGEK